MPISSIASTTARYSVRLGAAYGIVAGVSALGGWAWNMPRLTDWTGQGISMFPNAALCAVACGVALALAIRLTSPWRIAAARVAAALAMAIASLTLCEHLFEVDLGIDVLLMHRDWGQQAASAPMRMGLPASTSFSLLALGALFTTGSSRMRAIASMLAIVTAAIAMLSVTGYFFGADQLFGIAKYTGISLLTSSAILALSMAAMAAVPEHGLAAALRRDDAGGAVHRRLIVPVIAVPLLLGWLRIVGQNAGLYDVAFGTALRTLAEIALFFGLLWWTAKNISWHDSFGRKAEGRLGAIVESSDDVIVSKTLDGIIESWNAAAERIFGYSAAEAVGQHISIIIPPERLVEETEIISRLRRGERIDHFETVRLRKGGEPVNVSLTVSPVRDANGRVIGASKIARDISDRLRIEAERESLLSSERSARSDAERASQLKDEFLATLSHELRTPLNAILGWSQLLNLDPDKKDLQEGLDAIERNARAQTQLIEDLLDMSRIISGKVRLDVQPTNMATVIQEAIASIIPAADAKGITVRTVLDPNAGPISGDPTRLQQVVWNLLTNSIKFTPRGGKVDIVLARVNSHIEVTVRDTGIGISAEYLPVIFERFRQVDSSTTRLHGGLGLGLSIVRHLIELHGGTIHAESGGENQGASFYIALPLSPIRPDEDRIHPATARGHRVGSVDLAGSKVLVVDDEPDARLLVERLLANCGASVTAAGSAADGLEQLRTFRPHVLVSDIGMPVTDGYQFIRAVRKLGETEGGRTPAIALTAFARSEDRTQAMLAGYQMHIAKPIEPQELAVAVQMLSRQADSLGS